ncbi:hypothetical protein [Aureimonas frigidaquae]|uniref:hypothetical protein n=1 Tax=Aureimonas frigidaquae TaxID=424757 RepID=UPI00078291A0|nr:hypothetical protein [Aureimonas frigidaquae]
MPIRTNRAYNDPSIGAVFSNIASMFAPPSASDTYAYAKAKAASEEAARIQDFYAGATTMPQQDFDRQATALGIYNPTQSWRALDMGDATARYGVDANAATSRANNAADNQRALTERQMMEAAAMDRQNALPVTLNPGQRAFLPGQTAAATGLGVQLEGAAQALSTDEVVAAAMGSLPTADLQQFARDKFAPSETQVAGQDRRRLVENGTLSEQDLIDAIVGDNTPVRAIGADGAPTFMSPGAAVRTGAQAAPNNPLVQVNNGDAPDGKLRDKLDEAEGKRWSDLQSAAVTASGLNQDLSILEGLVDSAPQGPLVGRLAELFPEATTSSAAWQAVVSRAAPGLRVEGSGATSDIEYNGMLRSLPRLRYDPEANRLILETMKRKADINMRRGEIVSGYQNRELEAEDARRQLADLNRLSIMTPQVKAMIEAADPGSAAEGGAGASTLAIGTIEDGYRYLGGDPAQSSSWKEIR